MEHLNRPFSARSRDSESSLAPSTKSQGSPFFAKPAHALTMEVANC